MSIIIAVLLHVASVSLYTPIYCKSIPTRAFSEVNPEGAA